MESVSTELRAENHALRSAHQQRVDQFHILAGQGLPAVPIEPSEEVRLLRAKLIFEEAMETISALGVTVYYDAGGGEFVNVMEDTKFDISMNMNFVEVIDGCCDLRVVTTGTLTALGVPDEPFQKLIDENNLAKFGPGGYRADGTPENPGPAGKWIKPPGHNSPDILGMLQSMFGWGSKSKE